ncbi:hypothetical protein CRG98_041194 [Punica granatum]|uniref:Uncharacterized protein n=1 Tax=Punica granatum TaxID=22663 RepID=A0A2I0I354_PUNGR|nr:hypothetical protein CRG98_041194 [Punica granatum]
MADETLKDVKDEVPENLNFTAVDSPGHTNSTRGRSRMNPGFEGRVLARVNPKEFSTMCSCHRRIASGRDHVIGMVSSSHGVGHRARPTRHFTGSVRRPFSQLMVASQVQQKSLSRVARLGTNRLGVTHPARMPKCRHNAQVLGGALRVRPAWGGHRPRVPGGSSLGEGRCISDGGGMNRSDKGLNPRGSWQQDHCAPYNTPSRKALHGVQSLKTTGHGSEAPYTPSADSGRTSTHCFALNSVYVENHSDRITSVPLICKCCSVSSFVVAQLKRNR